MKNAIISIVSVIPTAFACLLIYSFPASSAVSGGSTGTGRTTSGDPVMGGVASYNPPPVGGPGRTTGSGTRVSHRGSGRVNPPSHRGSGRVNPTRPA